MNGSASVPARKFPLWSPNLEFRAVRSPGYEDLGKTIS